MLSDELEDLDMTRGWRRCDNYIALTKDLDIWLFSTNSFPVRVSNDAEIGQTLSTKWFCSVTTRQQVAVGSEVTHLFAYLNAPCNLEWVDYADDKL